MEIQIKYSQGTQVFYLWKGRVATSVVSSVTVKVNFEFDIPKVSINYIVRENKFSFPEDELFASKDNLINYLKVQDIS